MITPKKRPPLKPWESIAKTKKWDVKLVKKVWDEAIKVGVNPYLAVSVAGHESNFKITALNINTDGSSDYGIMQLNSTYHPQFRSDPMANIEYGVKYLRDQVKAYGWEMGIGAYNVGHSMKPEKVELRKIYLSKINPMMKEVVRAGLGTFEEVTQ